MKGSIETTKYDFWIFVLGISYYTLGTFLDMFSTMLIGQNQLDTLLYLCIIALLIMFKLKKNNFCVQRNIFVLPFVFLLLFAVDTIMPESLPSARARMFNSFIQQGIIGYFFARSLCDYQEIHRAVKWIAFIAFFSSAAILLFPTSILMLYDNLGDNNYGAYMFFGFRMLVAVILFMYLCYTEENRINKIFAIIGTIMLMVFANRGAVVTVAAFFILYNLFYAKGRVRFAFIFTVIIIVGGYYFLISKGMLQVVYSWLVRKGINSRNLELLLTSAVNETGRDHIYVAAIDTIGKHFFWGTGLSGAWRFGGMGTSYPHNIILEILIQFGVLPSIILGGYFFWKLYTVIHNQVDIRIGKLMLAFFVLGFIPLIFSGSYVVSILFWFMLGMLDNCQMMLKRDCDEHI